MNPRVAWWLIVGTGLVLLILAAVYFGGSKPLNKSLT